MNTAKTKRLNEINNDLKIKSHNIALRLAFNLCEAKADQEKRKVDAQCKTELQRDYSAYHALRSVMGNITALMVDAE